MIRDKYKIYGEMNDPNTVTATDELADGALVLGAGGKSIKAVTSFPKAADGLLIQYNKSDSFHAGSSHTLILTDGEPATLTFTILNQPFEVDLPTAPPIGDTTVNTVTSTFYVMNTTALTTEYFKMTFTVDVYRENSASYIVYDITLTSVKNDQDATISDEFTVNYCFNYYCPINFTNTDPEYNIKTINIEYSSADPTYGNGQVYQDNVFLGSTDDTTVDIDRTKEVVLINTFSKTNYSCGITVYNHNTVVEDVSGQGSSQGLRLVIPANTEFTRVLFWDNN